MSKDLFFLMREQEVMSDNFLPTKKELTKSTKDFAKELIEKAEHNPLEVYAQAKRLLEVVTILEKEFKDQLPQDNFEAFGMRGVYASGGDIPQYEEDEIYSALKKDLKEREELLKTALKMKDTFFDQYGNEVPKISTKPRKSSLRITF